MNKKGKICLNAMVGNEAPTILRMLESVAPYINYWVIQCNGKEDNTKKIIEDFFQEKAIPGFTYDIDWDYPGWNRNHTLQKCLTAKHKCDWILRMDADERLHVDNDFDWSIMKNTKVQSYNIVAENGDLKYCRTWFWNAKLPWFFQNDKRHETIHLPDIGENFERRNMPYGFRHLVSQDGQTWAAPRKFLKDALELEIDKVVGDKVMGDYYHLWYIGKSYSDCYGKPEELPFGKMHSDEYARRGIWYFQRFLQVISDWDNSKVAKNEDEMGYFALIIMSEAYVFLGETELAIEQLNLAGQFAPKRNEHFLRLCYILEGLKRYDEVLEITKKMLQVERVNPFPQMAFLIEGKAYYDTGTLIQETRDRMLSRLEDKNRPVMNLDSVDFNFK